MGTPLDSREEQVVETLDRLYDRYPDPEISLDFSNRLELLIAVILSAQCTDERVNGVTASLFETYDSAEAFAEADESELAEAINSITYYNNKASYIKSACRDIVDLHGGEVPDTMSELTDLAGVGRKTANVVLQHGHEVVEGIVVDTHVQRISRRLGLTEERSPPDRNGSHGDRPRRRLEGAHTLADQPRSRDLYRPKSGLFRLRPRRHLPLVETRSRGRSRRR